MKHNKLLLLVSLLSISALAGCNSNGGSIEPSSSAEGVPVDMVVPEADKTENFDASSAKLPDEILLNHRVMSLLVGEEYQLAPIAQLNYNGENLNYVIEDETIASVDETGLVKGLKGGKTNILVSDKDHPELSATVPLIVHKTVTNANAKTIASKIASKAGDDDLKDIVDYEMYEKSIYKEVVDEEGNKSLVLQSYDRYDQRMTLSYANGYFRIWETDAEIKTQDGAIDFTNYEWIFYTNAWFDTYIYHQSGDVKNFLYVPTQSYEEGDIMTPIEDIIDNLFTSGKKILTNTVENARVSEFTSLVGSSSDQILEGTQKSGSNGEDEMFFTVGLSFDSEVADQDTESRYGIPYGTPTPAKQYMRYTVQNNRLVHSAIYLEEEYDIGEDHYVEKYNIDHLYEDIDEEKSQIYVPDRKNYTQVATIFDV